MSNEKTASEYLDELSIAHTVDEMAPTYSDLYAASAQAPGPLEEVHAFDDAIQGYLGMLPKNFPNIKLTSHHEEVSEGVHKKTYILVHNYRMGNAPALEEENE